MSGTDTRSHFIWKPGLFPMLCVVMFVIAAMIVIVAGR